MLVKVQWFHIITLFAVFIGVGASNNYKAEGIHVLFGYLGTDYGEQIAALSQAFGAPQIFSYINFTSMNFNDINFEDALDSAQILVLGSKDSDLYYANSNDRIANFVKGGGVLVAPTYQIGRDYDRASLLYQWLGTPKLKVVDDYEQITGYMTVNGLDTPFAHLSAFGYPTMYEYLDARLGAQQFGVKTWEPKDGLPQEQNCMFKNSYNQCWLYAAPVYSGWQVNIPYDFNSVIGDNSGDMVRNLFLAIAGLLNDRGVSNGPTTLVYIPSPDVAPGTQRDMKKLLSDLSSTNNRIIVFSRDNSQLTINDLIAHVDLQSVVIPTYGDINSRVQMVNNYLSFLGPPDFDWQTDQNILFITMPNNVFALDAFSTIHDTFGTYLNQANPVYTSVHNFTQDSLTYPPDAFMNVPYLRTVPFTYADLSKALVTSLFDGKTLPDCILKDGTMADTACFLEFARFNYGFATFMSRQNKTFHPSIGYGTIYTGEWEREKLRAIVSASLQFQGPAVDVPPRVLQPLFDMDLPSKRILIYSSTVGAFASTAGTAAYLLGDNNDFVVVSNFNDIYDVLQDSYNYPDIDAIVIPGIYDYTTVLSNTADAIKDFLNAGKRVVWLVDKNLAYRNSYFNSKRVRDVFQDIGQYYIHPFTLASSNLPSAIIESQLNIIKNDMFYYPFNTIYDTYPFFYAPQKQSSNFVFEPANMGNCMLALGDFCTALYYQYNGVGGFTIITSAFQPGVQYWLEDYGPWAMMLARAVGQSINPNTPPSPTLSPTPTYTSTYTSTITPTITPSPSSTESQFGIASITPNVDISRSIDLSIPKPTFFTPTPTITNIVTAPVSTTPNPSNSRFPSSTSSSTSTSTPTSTSTGTATPSNFASSSPFIVETVSSTRSSSRLPVTMSSSPTQLPLQSFSPLPSPIMTPTSKSSLVILPPNPMPSLNAITSPSNIVALSPLPSASVFPSASSLPSRDGIVLATLPDIEVGGNSIGQIINVASPDGGNFGTVRVPDNFNSGILSVLVASNQNTDNKVSTPVFEIVLRDAQNNEIHDLDEPLKICFEKPAGKNIDNYCLGYYRESKGWQCEDTCLEEGNSNKEYCGGTRHLTNFALLLGGFGDECEDETSYVIAWVALGFISTAAIIVILSVVVIEVRFRHHTRKVKKKIRTLSNRTK